MKRWDIKGTNFDLIIHENKVINSLLISRGITSKYQADIFLNPDISLLYDPFLLKDMDRAIDRIDEAIKKREKIYIYGDYDVDGITSTAILYRAFKKLGVDVSFYIPDRVNEGYGINRDAIDHISSLDVDLVITVDCGISAIEEVEYAKEKGLDIIITDHHECKEKIPNTIAINPKRHDCQYPFKGLAGCGVAFKLVQALFKFYDLQGYEEFLDLVAIGTIADIVDITDENRIIVKYGLEKILKSDKAGINAIKQVAGIKDKITTYNVAFQIAPRLNAAGRLSDAKIAVELFITSDNEKAMQIAKYLDQENKKRQQIEQEILDECIEKIQREIDLKKYRVIVLSSPNWHVGVIGIVASRIVERFNRPTILFCEEGETLRGSGRSIKGFNLYDNLVECKDLLVKYGGHELAAGLTIEKLKLEEFSKRLNELAKKIDCEYFAERLDIDLELDSEDLSIETCEQLNLLEPFGMGNNQPVFCLKNARVLSKRRIGSEGQFIKMLLQKDSKTLDCVDFINNVEFMDRDWEYIDIAFNLNINEWNNTRSLQLNIKDIKPSVDYSGNRFKENYFRNIKEVLNFNDLPFDDPKNINFINYDLNFLKEFVYFKKGIILLNDYNSIGEVDKFRQVLDFNLYKNFGFEPQFILLPKVKEIDFKNNEVLIYDYLLNIDDYLYLDNLGVKVYHFLNEEFINRLKNLKNMITFDDKKAIKFRDDLMYNEVVGSLDDIACKFDINIFLLYRMIVYLKRIGAIRIFAKDDKIKIVSNSTENFTIVDELEDNFNKIINLLENKIREV
ncbi:MAG: single-stranded-DNA-specific exonuclease RecJ [Caloramator sp.]|nr:single-stranded-DNA-specific exonuclease RecJ [Caloramator sp.]